jgi:hypothetical protein
MNAAFAFFAIGCNLLCAGFKSDRRRLIQHDFPSEIKNSPSGVGRRAAIDRPESRP